LFRTKLNLFWMKGLRTVAVRSHMGPAVPTSASFCFKKSHACWVSACVRIPLLHRGSFKSTHDLRCMRTQTAPLFNVPHGRRGTTTIVVHPINTWTRAGRQSNPVAWERKMFTTTPRTLFISNINNALIKCKLTKRWRVDLKRTIFPLLVNDLRASKQLITVVYLLRVTGLILTNTCTHWPKKNYTCNPKAKFLFNDSPL